MALATRCLKRSPSRLHQPPVPCPTSKQVPFLQIPSPRASPNLSSLCSVALPEIHPWLLLGFCPRASGPGYLPSSAPPSPSPVILRRLTPHFSSGRFPPLRRLPPPPPSSSDTSLRSPAGIHPGPTPSTSAPEPGSYRTAASGPTL